MIKIIITTNIILMLCLSYCKGKTSSIPDEKTMIAKYEKIKKLRTIYISYDEWKDSTWTSIYKNKFHKSFDINNKELERHEYFHKSGKLILKTFSIYNEKGILVSSFSYMKPKGPKLMETFKYDASGYLTKIESFKEDGALIISIQYENNSAGNKIESNWYTRDLLEKRGTFKYDENKNNTEIIWFTNESLSSIVMRKYDKNGNKIEGYTHNPKGKLTNSRKYKYNSRGDLIEEVRYKFDSSPKWKFTYRNVYAENGK